MNRNLKTHYHLNDSQREIVLRTDSALLLKATRKFVENVTKTNPARDELLNEIASIKQSIDNAEDCELHILKHGYLKQVILDLFDAGKAEIVCGDQTYSSEMIHKESWSDLDLPGYSRGGYGGILYRDSQGQIILKYATWIS